MKWFKYFGTFLIACYILLCIGLYLFQDAFIFHPDKLEEIYTNIPKSLYKWLSVTTYIYLENNLNKVSRRSISSIFFWSNILFYLSKQQGAVKLSTDGAEFCATKEVVEETICIPYMLPDLGVKEDYIIQMCWDNASVVSDIYNFNIMLNKK